MGKFSENETKHIRFTTRKFIKIVCKIILNYRCIFQDKKKGWSLNALCIAGPLCVQELRMTFYPFYSGGSGGIGRRYQ